MARVGDICEILDGKRVPITASERQPGPYPYYGANGVQDYVADYLFDDDLVLVAEDGGFFDSKDKPIAYRVSGKCWVNNHAHVLKPMKGLNADYLCYSLMYYDVSSLVNGATRKKLTQAKLRQMEVPLPDFVDQCSIAAVLNTICAQITNRNRHLDNLGLLIKSRFIEMCKTVQCERVPISCFVSRDIVPVSKRYSADDEISYIDISSIDSANHRVKRTQKMPVSKAPSRAQQCVRDGDLLVSTVRPALRNIAQVKTGKANLVASSGFCVLRANSCPVEYLLANLLMDDFSDAMCLVATGASYPAIKKQDVLNYRVPNLPYEQMVELSSYMRQVDKLRFNVQQQIERLETLKKSLMQEYFG